MKIRDLCNMLEEYCQEDEIEIECPNGLLVDSIIKARHEPKMAIFTKPVGYVISWRD